MPKKQAEKLMLAEQILEVRYTPSGSFLDVRGYVADYIRESSFLPHWNIEPNVVSFRDKPGKVEKEGAFAGYRSAGYLVYDPQTRNFFIDRAGSFWRTLQKNKHYRLPPLERFGARTKVFVPSDKRFEDINRSVFQTFYTDRVREVIGAAQIDMQFVIELKDQGFDVRVAGGPIHKDEARRYFSFDSKEFERAGFFVDLDFYRTDDLKHDEVPRLLQAAVQSTWIKVENMAAMVGV
ncbi:hypothetical protein HY439_02425 [Candidatus Microgenomates bacterium]|nr:hypothetical protein [Candidatus Microgenomates bacterium]